MPKPVGSCIAFARKLPSQFNDHPWLAETSDGTSAACCYCWSNAAGDPRVMECDLLVREDHRCEGIGSRLLATICDETLNEGRSLLTKAAMLERVRHERPGAQRVRTDGAFSNAPMLAIYDAFGFKAIGTRTEW